MDGASEVATFFRVIIPVMRPINLVVLVVTVINSLRAFDLVWVDQQGPQRAGDHRGAGDAERRRRGQPDRLRVGARDDHAADLLGLRGDLPERRPCERSRSDHHRTARLARAPRTSRRSQLRTGRAPARVVLQVFLLVTALVVAVPAAVGAVQLAARLRVHLRRNGYVSFGGFTLKNYVERLGAGRLRPTRSWNSVVHHGAGGVLTLLLASCDGLRALPLQLQAQPERCSGCSSAREPAAAAGAADPDLPAVPGDHGPVLGQRLRHACSTATWGWC